ncbi:MAG: hypothetical protein OCU22_09300 [Canidatus Methanoxibalbensis ujae]|nr:hypothetical protein [Candidatus Methanoxibalbensis ujae]
MYCDVISSRYYYIGWDEVFDMEDVAGYVYGFYANPRIIEADLKPTIYYYNEFGDHELAQSFYAHATSGWKAYQGFIRKMNEYKQISVGFKIENASGNNRVRLDKFYLIPVYNIDEISFSRTWSRREGAGEYEDDIYIFCVGRCNICFTAHVNPHSIGVDSEVDIYVRPLTRDGHKTYNNPIHWTVTENTYFRIYSSHDIAGVNVYTTIDDDDSDYTIDYYLTIKPE